MNTYTFKARNQDGSLITGAGEAVSLTAMQDLISARGLVPVHIRQKGDSFLSLSSFFSGQFKIKSLIVFTRQFQAMFKVGVPIDRILETLAGQSSHVGFQSALLAIRGDIAAGARLAAAFEKHPTYFNDLYVNMINIGEEAGILEQTLNDLSGVLMRDYRTLAQIKAATLYPKIVVGVLIMVIIGMFTFVIPEFAKLYEGRGAQLPALTQTIMYLNKLVVGYAWVYLPLFLTGLFFWRRFKKTDHGKWMIDRFILQIPVYGNLQKKVIHSRLGHLLAALYKSGVPLSRALEIIKGSLSNKLYSEALTDVIESIEGGESVATALAHGSLIYPIFTEVVAVGEQTGTLDEMLDGISTLYDEEIDDTVKTLSTFIEPILIIAIFVVVAVIAFALYLPMWNIYNTI